MNIGDLAKYLMVSRQILAGLVSRMERDGRVGIAPDTADRRSRIVTMTEPVRHAWRDLARPKIRAYYERVLEDFSVNDAAHMLHYLLKMLEGMRRLDGGGREGDIGEPE
jgi:DNA-binding MarR family transcriptional regulator